MYGERRKTRKRRNVKRKNKLLSILALLEIFANSTRKRTTSKSKDKVSRFSKRKKSTTNKSLNSLDTSSQSSNEHPVNSSVECSEFFVLLQPLLNKSKTPKEENAKGSIYEAARMVTLVLLPKSSGSDRLTNEFLSSLFVSRFISSLILTQLAYFSSCCSYRTSTSRFRRKIRKVFGSTLRRLHQALADILPSSFRTTR